MGQEWDRGGGGTTQWHEKEAPSSGERNEKTRNEEKLEEKKGGQGLGFFLRFKPCIRNI